MSIRRYEIPEHEAVAAQAFDDTMLSEWIYRNIHDGPCTLAQIIAELRSSNAQNQELNGQIAELRQELADKAATVDAMLHSTSWRISAPLRAAKQLMRIR
jgi:hypothetical protein